MNTEAFLKKYTRSLEGKTLIITGASGGLGRELCRCLVPLGGRFVLLNHSPEKAEKLKAELKALNPRAEIISFSADFENCRELKELCQKLKPFKPDYLIHNAGNYYMPRRKSAMGLDCVFQINFLSPYFITKSLLPELKERGGKVVIMGSIAHGPVRAREYDPDYSRSNMAEAVYGNSKRYLIYAHKELLRDSGVELAVAHPGISPTGITDNYPKFLRRITKPSMKLIFMPPRKAVLGLLRGIFDFVPELGWIGPGYLGIWGEPVLSALPGCDYEERKLIYDTAEKLYKAMEELP